MIPIHNSYKVAKTDQIFSQPISSVSGTCIRFMHRININPQEVKLLVFFQENGSLFMKNICFLSYKCVLKLEF